MPDNNKREIKSKQDLNLLKRSLFYNATDEETEGGMVD